MYLVHYGAGIADIQPHSFVIMPICTFARLQRFGYSSDTSKKGNVLTKLSDDPRIDPRIKAMFGGFELPALPDVANRQELLDEANSEAALAATAALQDFLNSMGSEKVAPSTGLSIRTEQLLSAPDGNSINMLIIRPEGDEVLPCVYYIHGGGMLTQSCYDTNYQAWGRMIAAAGVVVTMVDFRNALLPSSVPEVLPFPAGLNDCIAGLKWVIANADRLAIDADRIVVAGDSGGGNLTLATGMKLLADGDAALVKGLYAMCPFIGGIWPVPGCPSSIENDGIFLGLHNNRFAMGYGIEAYENKNPLAWPVFATADDIRGLPPVVISVNECDPARDEGINFYRLLLHNGVAARCRQVMGSVHATEIFPVICPDLSSDSAHAIARFATD
ncbi:MAG: esterase [Sphingomonadales bacterium]|nr:esterase [Sphingomonadales bacterium]